MKVPCLPVSNTFCCLCVSEALTSLEYSLTAMSTYVRTEVNYTEEVDDPIDSDGEDLLSLSHLTLDHVVNLP